jgi:hypothetical protein
LKKLILSLFVVALAHGLRADTLPGPYAYLVTSWGGSCYFKMLPPQWENGAVKDEGSGIAYRLKRDGSSQELWRTTGWYSLTTFLDDDPGYLVRLSPWNLGHDPSSEDVAVAFYKEGKLLKQYSTADLVKDATKVLRFVSHYEWQAVDIERNNNIFVNKKPEHKEKEPGLWCIDRTFHLKTCDNISYVFDITTGNIKSAKQE